MVNVMTDLKKIVIWTDGACKGNPGPGGWGVLMVMGEHRKEMCGGTVETTNNRMELMAVIEALGVLNQPCAIRLRSDSKYVLQGIKEWMPNWKMNGWKTANRKPVKNADLWQRLDVAMDGHEIQLFYVVAHSGEVGNERADALANQGVVYPPIV